MKTLTHGSLFSGIGGFDLAAEWMGWQNIFHCEWNPFGQTILKHYWPHATSYNDITKTDFSIHRGTIDVLTGGFPCQPYSSAGKRLGKEDERHLWPEMLRAIREIQPQWVVGENVRGLLNWNGGLVFHEVQAELEAEGYEVQPFLLPAASVNAPHERYRIWFIAFNSKRQSNGGYSTGESSGNGLDMEGNQLVPSGRVESANHFKPSDNNGAFADPNLCTDRDFGRQGREKDSISELGRAPIHSGESIGTIARDDANACNAGLQRSKEFRSVSSGRKVGNQQLAGLLPSDWQKFPTEPPLCSGDDGFPNELDGITFSKWRNESIKAGGNAIVPQVALQIFKAIQQLNAA